jgi:hypothetical protein
MTQPEADGAPFGQNFAIRYAGAAATSRPGWEVAPRFRIEVPIGSNGFVER